MRPEDPLSGDARRLIDEHIESVGALDLLLLARDDPERWWTPDEVAETLHCPARWAALRLEDLRAGGLLAADGDLSRRYAFRPQHARLSDLVDELAEVYATQTRDVVRLIFSAGRRPRSLSGTRSRRNR